MSAGHSMAGLALANHSMANNVKAYLQMVCLQMGGFHQKGLLTDKSEAGTTRNLAESEAFGPVISTHESPTGLRMNSYPAVRCARSSGCSVSGPCCSTSWSSTKGPLGCLGSLCNLLPSGSHQVLASRQR